MLARPPCDEAVIRAGQAPTPCARAAEPWILAAAILGSSIVFIDGTVVNLALPVVQAELGATLVEVQWIFEAYALSLAALLLVGGSLGDHFGRRRIFIIGVGIFSGASAACGLSQDAQTLIAARAVQGVGGAMLTPGSLAIIGAAFSEDRRGQAIGTWSSFTAVAAALGPVLGGLLIQQASWRWVFFLNLPLAAIVLGIALWHVPESRDEAPGDLDWWGALLATVGLAGVVYGLIESSNRGLAHPVVLASLALGVGALALFLAVEARGHSPMMPLSLFRARTFAGVNLLTFLLYGSLSGALFFLPFNLVQVQGYSTTAAGAALLPFVVVMFAVSRWAGSLLDRYGAAPLLVGGPTTVAAATALYAVPGIGGSYWTTFFPAIVLHGLGMALTVAPLTTVVMTSVDARHVGLASGINNAISRTAGLLAIAALGVVVVAAFGAALDGRLAGLSLPADTVQALAAERTRLAELEVPPGLGADLSARVQLAIDESFVDGFRVAALISAGLALGAALSALLTVRRGSRTGNQAATGPLGTGT